MTSEQFRQPEHHRDVFLFRRLLSTLHHRFEQAVAVQGRNPDYRMFIVEPSYDDEPACARFRITDRFTAETMLFGNDESVGYFDIALPLEHVAVEEPVAAQYGNDGYFFLFNEHSPSSCVVVNKGTFDQVMPQDLIDILLNDPVPVPILQRPLTQN